MILFICRTQDRLVLVAPTPSNIKIQTDRFLGILDTTDIWCYFTLYGIPRPKLIDMLVLDDTTPYILYDLSQLPNNSFIEIKGKFPNDMAIEFLFVTDSDYGILDIFTRDFENYLTT